MYDSLYQSNLKKNYKIRPEVLNYNFFTKIFYIIDIKKLKKWHFLNIVCKYKDLAKNYQ